MTTSICLWKVIFTLLWMPWMVRADLNNVFGDHGRALIPPRGWNSFASYSWAISEDDFLENAELVAKYLKNFGYQYVVVDNLWFRKADGVSTFTSGSDTLDAWGRPLPDPDRWPSSKNGQGFRVIADKVHQLGLKFGISVLRGIHKVAVEQNTPIFGTQGKNKQKWFARDIAVLGEDCSFMPDCFIGVNVSSDGGRQYLKSLYRQYADWGVDFIKHDCVFGERDLLLDEILAVSQAILHTGRQIVYSLAPGGGATPVMAAAIANVTNMYRVAPNIWDSWVEVEPAFNIARDFASSGLVGATGLGGGRSWPDLDVLPFGWLTDSAGENGAYRASRLTDSEMKTQMTLWGMARSPIMFGGDMKHLDQTTLDVLTNPAVLEINSYSLGNSEILRFATEVRALKVADCGDSASQTIWNSSGGSQICWKTKNNTEGCLNWIPHHSTNGTNVGRVQMHGSSQPCLDATTGEAEEYHGKYLSSHFSTCRDHPSQTWRLTPDSHLVDDHFGRCALVVEEDDLTRIWAAYGFSGQVYLAFFNASPRKTQMSIKLPEFLDPFYSSLAVANSSSMIFGPLNKTKWRCLGEEVWSGKRVEETESMSFKVDGHGCALFVLSCNYNLQGKSLKTLSRALLASFIGIVAILTLLNVIRYCYLSQHRHKR